MKATILKSLLPPLFFFVLYLNINYFVFSFDARHGYLNKRLNKTNNGIEELQRDIKQLVKDKQNTIYDELSNTLKELDAIKNNSVNLLRNPVNIYKKLKMNKLTLLSEQSVKSAGSPQKEFTQLTNFIVTGNYQNVIKTLRAIEDSELIPVSFSLFASSKNKTRYSISIWNKNE